jgi:hypothetical protein
MRTSVIGTVAILLYGATITGCQNKYEDQLVGIYMDVPEAKWNDLTVHLGTVVLALEEDGTYHLRAHGTETQGTWEAGDNGDWTWIDFHGTKDSQGRVLGEHLETIDIQIPAVFCCPEMTALRLKRKVTTLAP